MPEIIIRCCDCVDENRPTDQTVEGCVWQAVYLAFYDIPVGATKMINLIDQSRPIRTSKYGGNTILNHHTTNKRSDGIRHSQFDVLSLEDGAELLIARLVCSTSTQMFYRDLDKAGQINE